MRERQLWERAEDAIWKGGTEAKQRAFLEKYGLPGFLERAQGCRIWDSDSKEYVDYLMSWGTVLLGHGHSTALQAAMKRMETGAILNLLSEDEVLLAERLLRLIPCAEAVRFVASGSEATTAAVRVARAATKRNRVIKLGYHGWLDWNQNDHPAGVLPQVIEELKTTPYNRLSSLEELLDSASGGVACVVLEPLKDALPEDGFLEKLVATCRQRGVLVIFDEMKTGFRIALGGAQEHLGVKPDLATFGKALSNGFPIGVLVGAKAVFEGAKDVWVNGTYHGWPPSMAASLATLDFLESQPVLEHVWRVGRELMAGFNAAMETAGIEMRLVGLPPMPRPRFPAQESNLAEKFFRAMARRGVFLHPNHAWFLSWAHSSEDVAQTLEAVEESLLEVLK